MYFAPLGTGVLGTYAGWFGLAAMPVARVVSGADATFLGERFEMALLWMDGFDRYAAQADLNNFYTPNAKTFATSSGRFGGGAVSWNTTYGNQTLGRALASPELDLWTGFAFKASTANGYTTVEQEMLSFRSSYGYEVLVSFDGSTRSFKAYRGQGSTLLGTSSGNAYSVDTWHWVEVRAMMDDTVGVVEVWVDGVRVLNVTGADTKNNASATGFQIIHLGCQNTFNRAAFDADDWYVLRPSGDAPTNRTGDCRIRLLRPNTDVAPNDGTPSAGTDHYGVVDDTPGFNTTDYVTLPNTTGVEERFGFEDLPANAGDVLGLAVISFAQKTDAGVAAAHHVIRSAAATSTGATFNPATSWTGAIDFFALDPNTSALWTAAAVNALSVGYVVE